MKTQIYKRLPEIRINDICPICRQKVYGHKNVRVELHNSDYSLSATAECCVLYCATCALPFANTAMIMETKKKYNGLKFDLINVCKKTSVRSIENQIKYSEKNKISYYNIPVKNEPYEIVEVSHGAWIWEETKTLISIDENITVCPKCLSTLYSSSTFISISEKQKTKIPGLLCSKCKCLYVKNKNDIDKIMRDNQYAKGFTLDGKSLWNATQRLTQQREDEKKRQIFRERIVRLRAIESAVVMICVSFEDKSLEEFVIVSQLKASNPKNRILYYASVEAREILSAAFAKERDYRGTYGGKALSVLARPIYPDSGYMVVSESILPTKLGIEHGGGYYSSVVNRNYEIVDLLLYSPFNNRYELIQATYNKSKDYCFVDIGLYRNFVKNHGNPGLNLVFDESKTGLNGWDNLNDESILKGYGYSVSQVDAFSTAYRQELLAEIIDLMLCTVPKIVNLLDFFIRTHSSEKYMNARHKWTEDKRFVEKYRVNTSRFLIANIN